MSSHFTNCLFVQYAEDTQFLHTGEVEELNTLVLEAETTQSRARQFYFTHGLKLNSKKTQCIFLGTRQLIPKIPANTTITFHNTTIKPTTHVKNLGVHFNTYVTFEAHINEISKKVTGTLMYTNRVKNCFGKLTRILVVPSLMLILLNYCNTI